MKIAVLVSGGGTNLQAIIDSVASGEITNVEIALVISNKENTYALKRAEMAGIKSEVICPKKFAGREEYSCAMVDIIKSYDIELIVLAGFLVVLPESFVNAFEGKIINIHPSLIPSFCGDGFYGLKVHEEALKRGVKVTGATVHYVDKGTDTGPIIAQRAVNVLYGDTPEILQKRVMEEAEWIILPKAIDDIANGRIKYKNEDIKL